MMKLGSDTRLATKALARIDTARAVHRRQMKYLDGDFLPRRDLPRSIHAREAAGTEETGNLVAALDCRVACERKIFHELPQRTTGYERQSRVELGRVPFVKEPQIFIDEKGVTAWTETLR